MRLNRAMLRHAANRVLIALRLGAAAMGLIAFAAVSPLAAAAAQKTFATPAAAVIGEAVVAVELAKAFLDKFGGDSVRELKRNVESYREACQRW